MALEPASANADLDRYIGYLEPYATSHDALDATPALVTEIRNTMRVLVERTRQRRAGTPRPGADLVAPRPK
ncbi:MAG: hypothetical protein M3680_16205 [Myxococcota bacterium]|nr:hypothetical protein [Myxococcota bacterium]